MFCRTCKIKNLGSKPSSTPSSTSNLEGDYSLCGSATLQQLVQVPTGTVLHHEVARVILLYEAFEGYDVGVIEHTNELDFSVDHSVEIGVMVRRPFEGLDRK